MIDHGEVADHVSGEADPDLHWAWEQVADPGHISSPLALDPVRDPDETAAPDHPELGLPESLWGEGLTAGALPVTVPAARPAPRRRSLAPARVPRGRKTGLRPTLGRLRAAPRVAALALVVVVVAGLLLALAAREPDTAPGRASQQIDAAGLRSTSTIPIFTVPGGPSTSLTTLVTSPQPDSNRDEAPATTLAPPPPAATAAATPVTTGAPRSPVRANAPMAPVAFPDEPPPAPTPTATVASPPPSTIALLPVEPETTATTRRPRSTVPETTVAPSTTVPASDDLPVVED